MKRYLIDRRSLLRHSVTGAIGLAALPHLGVKALADDSSAQRVLKAISSIRLLAGHSIF